VPGGQGPPRPAVAVAAAVAGGSLVDIQADEATNSLVITAPPEADPLDLRSVIAQLDVRRAQVLVEAVIAEISAEKTAELGVQWVSTVTAAGGLHQLRCRGNSSLANVIGLAASRSTAAT
jgi:general secretion pathway protein D